MKVAALCLGGNTFGCTTDQKVSEAVVAHLPYDFRAVFEVA